MSYPATVDSFPTEVDQTAGDPSTGTTIDAADINQHSTAIIAIETELGTTPSGSFTTVRERLEALGCRFNSWWQKAIPATQAATAMGVAGDTTFPEQIVARAGSVVSLAIRATAARTAGTLTCTVTKNGVATALTAVLDGTNPQTKVTLSAIGSITFVAGDRIGVTLATDSAWLPAGTDNVIAAVEVSYT